MGAFNNASYFFPVASDTNNKLIAAKPQKTDNFDPDLTFTGPANRTRVNPQGILETVGLNDPAFDFSRTDKCARLLMGPPVTNNALDSTDTLSNFTTGSNLSATADTIFGQDSVIIAATSTGAITNTTEQHSRVISASYGAGNFVTFSFLAKKNGSHNIAGYLLETATQAIGGYFNLDTLATGSIIGDVATDSRTRKVTALRDDVFLCEETIELTDAETFTLYSLAPTEASSTVTSGDDMIFGLAQLENHKGSTPRILTTTSAVSRGQSDWIKTDIAPILDSSEYTLAFKGIVYNNANLNYMQLDDGTGSNRITFATNTSGEALFQIAIGGVTSAALNGGTILPGETFCMVASMKEDDLALFVNGVKVEQDNSGAGFSPGLFTRLQSSSAGSLDFDGEIEYIMIDNIARSDAYCINLSTL